MHNFTPSYFEAGLTAADEAEAKAEARERGFRTSPSPEALSSILAFSKAVEMKRSTSGRNIELLLN